METPATRRPLNAALAAALLVVVATVASAESRTVEVTAEVFGHGLTPEQGRRKALQRARDRAVAEVTGIHVAAQQLRLKTVSTDSIDDAFSYLVHTSTRGRIVDEQVTFDTRLIDDVPVYRATLRAEVALEEGVRDPGFLVELETQPLTHTYRDGEPIELRVTVSRDCFLTLLNLRDDGTMSLLYPNRFDRDNRLAAGERVALPRNTSAFAIRAELDGRRARGTEQILAIATLDSVPFRVPETAIESDSAAGRDPMLAALNRWLMQIPVERRAEAVWDYRVVE
jgi:hypothetical protein